MKLVKATPGILDADPRLVPGARLLPAISHHFLTELALAGAKVMHHPAAVLAERAGLRLRFDCARLRPGRRTVVEPRRPGRRRGGRCGAGAVPGERVVSVVTASASPGLPVARALDEAAARSGARVLHAATLPHVRTFLVTAEDVPVLAAALHAALHGADLADGGGEWMAERTA